MSPKQVENEGEVVINVFFYVWEKVISNVKSFLYLPKNIFEHWAQSYCLMEVVMWVFIYDTHMY